MRIKYLIRTLHLAMPKIYNRFSMEGIEKPFLFQKLSGSSSSEDLLIKSCKKWNKKENVNNQRKKRLYKMIMFNAFANYEST